MFFKWQAIFFIFGSPISFIATLFSSAEGVLGAGEVVHLCRLSSTILAAILAGNCSQLYEQFSRWLGHLHTSANLQKTPFLPLLLQVMWSIACTDLQTGTKKLFA